jgi:hypothetical protein
LSAAIDTGTSIRFCPYLSVDRIVDIDKSISIDFNVVEHSTNVSMLGDVMDAATRLARNRRLAGTIMHAPMCAHWIKYDAQRRQQ